jgi:hypothetical protein
MIARALSEGKRDGRYGFIAPYRQQAKDIAWNHLKRYAEPIVVEEPRESDLSVQLIGGPVLRLYGADNPDAIRVGWFDSMVLDEFADMRESPWSTVVRPMLSDRHGWATFIGTPKGKNAFYDVWHGAQKRDDWFSLMLKASDSRLLLNSELVEAREHMGEDLYNQEFECSFEAAIRGAFYGEEMRVMLSEGRRSIGDRCKRPSSHGMGPRRGRCHRHLVHSMRGS